MNEKIIRIAARGDGVTASGKHAALAAPGDILTDGGQIEHGPHHTDPACRHFPTCGGCQLQHLDEVALAAYVTDRIVGGLAAQGVDAPEMRLPHLSPARTRRRASLRAERRGKQILIGFHESGTHKIVDLRECPVLHPALFALIQPLRGLLVTLIKDRRSADVRMTVTDTGVDLLIAKIEVEGLAATEALTDFALTNKLARLSIDEGYGASARWEPDPVTVTLSGVPVVMPEGAFLQATADGEDALVSAVRAVTEGAEHVADLFAGLGTFALSVPGAVHAVEGARDAALGLQAAAKAAGRDMVVEHRDLFRRPLTVQELARFDVVILDPPRAGAREQIEQLAASTVPRIAYVSCNPASFARDAKTLIEGGYMLKNIQPVGQFRWSTHVELAAAFHR
ncbi:MAG: class I SAM-dependent RNA methyltransferase [Chakrabartia sp.]